MLKFLMPIKNHQPKILSHQHISIEDFLTETSNNVVNETTLMSFYMFTIILLIYGYSEHQSIKKSHQDPKNQTSDNDKKQEMRDSFIKILLYSTFILIFSVMIFLNRESIKKIFEKNTKHVLGVLTTSFIFLAINLYFLQKAKNSDNHKHIIVLNFGIFIAFFISNLICFDMKILYLWVINTVLIGMLFFLTKKLLERQISNNAMSNNAMSSNSSNAMQQILSNNKNN